MTHLIDVVIPVHTATRPIDRAVASVLAADNPSVHALVVCHNVPLPEIMTKLIAFQDDPRLRLVELIDGVHSPAGPLNEGVRVSSAEYLGFLGSDDELEAGALDTWAEELRTRPDLLIGQLSSEGAGRILAPAPRPGRFAKLDPVKDLLNYRSAPVGVLIARRLLAAEGVPVFAEGYRTGEDLGVGLHLWNTSSRIDYSRCAVGYLIREDDADRATTSPIDPEEVQLPVREAVRLPSLARLPLRRKQAIAVKLLRHQVLEWMRSLHNRGLLGTEASEAAGRTVQALTDYAPGALGYFNRIEARCLRALRAVDIVTTADCFEEDMRTLFRRKVVPSNPLRLFAPEHAITRIRRSRLTPAHLLAPERTVQQ